MKLQEFKNLWEHAHDSDFEREMENPEETISGINASCGDEIVLMFQFDKNKKISDASFQHSGCTISYIACSLFLQNALGKSLEEIRNMGDRAFLKFFRMEISGGRLHCALLPLEVVKKYRAK